MLVVKIKTRHQSVTVPMILRKVKEKNNLDNSSIHAIQLQEIQYREGRAYTINKKYELRGDYYRRIYKSSTSNWASIL